LGLGYLSSYLAQHGILVEIVDGLRDNLANEALCQTILEKHPDAVGITCLTAFYPAVVDLSLRLKRRGMRVIIGGVHPSFLPYETLADSHCDYVVVGEGEIALLKLVQSNFRAEGIPGVYSLDNLEPGANEPLKAEIVKNLDDLPFPDWDQLDPNSYPQAPHGAIVKQFPIGVITSTRGCPYRCSFCASPKFYDRRVRFRSPENVVEEIKYLVSRFGVKEIHFEDDNLTLRRDHIEKLCRLIIAAGVNVGWACPNGIRADRVDRELMRLMKKSGCYYFAYGVESANEQILTNIHKEEPINTIEESIRIAAEEGISCQGFFIFGLPGENPSTIAETIRFAKNSKLARAQFLILDVLPGSELWDTLHGEFTPNWSKKSYKEPEWLPAGVTREHLLKAQSRAFREFYLHSPSRLFPLLRAVRPGQLLYLLHRLREYRILGSRA
jgi:radical SAM superfamily enzyme YgiQ (UPF0313 family)